MTEPATMVNAFDPARSGALDERSRALVQRRTDLLGPAYRLFYENPIEVVRGEGVHLFGPGGERYLDAYNNVPSVGHCNQHVTAAVTRQLQTLNTHTRYLGEPILDYAERLLATHPDSLDRVMFTCSGSEANDLALRIARVATGADGVIVTTNAYHGVTARVAEISPSLGENVPLGEHVRVVSPPSSDDDADSGAAFGARVGAAIDDLKRHGVRTAAVLMDTIFSSDGIIPAPAGFLTPVVDVAHGVGALFIADEVQAGFGRCGDGLWGYARHAITPDIVTMGKPMGNGMPIAAVVARRDLIDEFGATSRYFNTFGGNAVCIAAAAAVLDVIEEEHLIDNARIVGARIADGLRELAARDQRIGEIRQAGLFVGVDVVTPGSGDADAATAHAVVNGLRERRVLVSATGIRGHTLKIRPPLPFSAEDAEELLGALADTLAGRPMRLNDR